MPPKKKTRAEDTPVLPALPPVVWQRAAPSTGQWLILSADDAINLEAVFKAGMPMAVVTEMSFAKDVTLTYDLKAMTETNTQTNETTSVRRLVPGVWEWMDDNALFVPFYDEDNVLIETRWRTLPLPDGGSFKTKDLSFNKGYDSTYQFTLKAVPTATGEVTGEQLNEDSGTKRVLRRSTADVSLAVWDKSNFGIAGKALPPPPLPAPPGGDATLVKADSFSTNVLNPPSTWEPQTTPLQYFDVKDGTKEFKDVTAPFLKKLGKWVKNPTIISVRRIQNDPLWKFYALTRYRVGQRNKGDPKELTQLYHGCRVRENLNSIIEYGFDMRVARDGLSGVGIYFALSSSYSNGGYVLQNPDKSKEMLVCRVAVGSYTQGKHGMKRPPVKDKKSGELYDSVARLPDMHVVFDNSQAYPEYIIKYRHT